MLKKSITYTDYNGVEKTETHYFHLSERELTKMTMSEYGTMDERLKAIVDAKDSPQIMDQFEDLIRLSYGIKMPDGRFVKKRDGHMLFDEFESTAAYDKLYMELCTDPKKAAEFARGILPDNMRKEAELKLSKDPETAQLMSSGPTNGSVHEV